VCIYRGECLYLYFALASSLLTMRRSLTDFVNLKIKLVQPFESDSRGRVCVHIFIEMSTRIYISICVCMTYEKKSSDSSMFKFVSHLRHSVILPPSIGSKH
jgi:hypothetical protein